MDTSNGLRAAKFPAIRVGIIAGISAAVTLSVVGGLVSLAFLRLAGNAAESIRKVDAQVQKQKEQVSPEFKSLAAAYLSAVEKEHAAAARGWKPFQGERPSVKGAEQSLENSTKTTAEIRLQSDIFISQIGYDTCVEYAIGPTMKMYKLPDCENKYPVSQVKDAVDRAEAVK